MDRNHADREIVRGMVRRSTAGIVARLFAIFLFVLIAVAGFGQAVLQLWNRLMPTLFGLPAVTFWQAVGLLALSWILFGGWRGYPSRSWSWRRRVRERWAEMTPEERQAFREAVEGRLSRRADAGAAGTT
jgi:hypothetical protein